ncbi:osteomodulin isoform X2 [Anolis carolinensis]|nr:PREDICTED: osteomodulin isoform X2 [Anolis carolinensis]XP_008103386.1 PREDICTED: osteomodulin isoform X2 [Anolis carolinensis]|eukprot:XP_003217708.1 PREDICTED: osteomodulin isoform X2 [Anolis carolinensis]
MLHLKLNMGFLSLLFITPLLFGVTVCQYEFDDFEDDYENEIDHEYPRIFHHNPGIENVFPYFNTPNECAKECFCPPNFPIAMYCDHRKLQKIPSIPSHIQQVYLQYNDIKAVHLESFVNATALKEIDLSHNKINSHMIDTGVFAKLSNLAQLHLQYNLLEEVPYPLPRSLERLILGFNQISSLHRKAIEGLVNLTMIDLCSNYLEDSQFKGIQFSNTNNLMQLNLCSNRLQSMPPELPSSLMYLSLENNSISVIPNNYFQRLPKLLALRMSYNNLQEVPHNAFNIPGLVELNLGHNKLKQVFYIPRSLQHLYIEDNEIEVMNITLMCPSLDPLNFSHLTYIRVDQNKLTAPLSTYAFFCFPHIRSIYYGEQKLSTSQRTQLRTPVFRRYLTPEEYEEAEDGHEDQDHENDIRGREDDDYFDSYLY